MDEIQNCILINLSFFVFFLLFPFFFQLIEKKLAKNEFFIYICINSFCGGELQKILIENFCKKPNYFYPLCHTQRTEIFRLFFFNWNQERYGNSFNNNKFCSSISYIF